MEGENLIRGPKGMRKKLCVDRHPRRWPLNGKGIMFAMIRCERFPKLPRENYEERASETLGGDGGLTENSAGGTNSSRDLTDDDVQRVASIPADAPSSLRRIICTDLLRSCKVFSSGRQANIRKRSQCLMI